MTSSQETINRALRLVGTQLRDKWRLDALIGIGGMASVYSATHRNGKRGAIKILNRDLSEGESTRARFLREGYVANKVGHPGVVAVLDDDISEDGRAFLVMELLEGETLKERWIRWKKRIPIDEVLRTTHALLDVLAAAHDKGIVHRDIKPDNVFLTNDGVLKVLDFGIARLRETSDAADATRSSAMLGTPAFMAPEQARSRWEWVDARTDLWAVGATMFTSLTGHFVHQGMTVTELLVVAAMSAARPIRSVMPELPEAAAAIIDRALAFDQAQRWPDARSMQVAVKGLLDDIDGAAAKVPARATTQPMPVRAPETPAELSSPTPQLVTPSSFPQAGPVPQPPPAPISYPQSSPVSYPQTSPVAQIQDAPESVGPSSTLMVSGTSSVTLQATQAIPSTKTNPLVFAAVGAVLVLGLIGGFFIVRSDGNNAAKDGTAHGDGDKRTAEPNSQINQPSVDKPASNVVVTVDNDKPAQIAPDSPPVAMTSASVAPSSEAPRSTTKPRTTATAKKKDPFDKY